MKYAIYDKAADGYLTKMEFKVGYSDHTLFECGYNEYITEAQLLDTPKEAADAIARIESSKFMEKGRFVMHSFDDTLKDHYIISEAGNPTKVVDNITVNIDGTIDVKYGTMVSNWSTAFLKYGTMVSHWSTAFLEYAVNRMNALQKAENPRYTAWCNNFDIYKVITVIDEKSCTNYQFINVTDKGLKKYSKDEEAVSFNTRIDELKRANDILTEDINYHNDCRLALVDMIRAIKYAICSKDGDKRNNYISYMTDKIKDDEIFNRPELKTAKTDIPKICKHLAALAKNPLNKRIEELEKANYELGQQSLARGLRADRLKEENNDLKTKVEAIKKEASNWKNRYKTALRDCALLENVIDNIYDDLFSTDICKNLNDTLNYVKDDIYSELNRIKILNDNTDDCEPIYISAATELIFIINQIIAIMEGLELNQSVAFASADEVDKARGVAYDIISICEADDKFEVTLKKFSQLYEAMNAVHNIDDDPIMHAFKALLLIFSTMDRKLEDFAEEIVSWKNKAQKAEKALDDQKKLNDANKATIARMVAEKLDLKEQYRHIANSVYGMTIPGRCYGKQMFYDVTTGTKILIDKKKYDDLVEYVAKYKFLSTITKSLNDLTK